MTFIVSRLEYTEQFSCPNKILPVLEYMGAKGLSRFPFLRQTTVLKNWCDESRE